MISLTGPNVAFAVFLPQRAGGFRVALETVRPTKAEAIAALGAGPNEWRRQKRKGAFAGRVSLTPISAPPPRRPPSSALQPGLFECATEGDTHAD